jgi:nitroimidazol reductase NimA-like FMN-containing flavoprotein (pyridoxamine 5'-phosphate oxidase superfamily)
MRRKDREVTEKEAVEAILDRCMVLRLGLAGQPPYVVPVSFGWQRRDDGLPVLYFHTAGTGRLPEQLKDGALVTVEADRFLGTAVTAFGLTTRYESVIGWGDCRLVEEEEEKKQALQALNRHYGYEDFPLENCGPLAHVRVYRIVLEELTAKQNLPKQ